MAFGIADYEGVIPVARIKEIFEQIVNETPTMRRSIILAVWQDQYADPTTQSMFAGFAIGLRCAERFNKAGQPLA